MSHKNQQAQDVEGIFFFPEAGNNNHTFLIGTSADEETVFVASDARGVISELNKRLDLDEGIYLRMQVGPNPSEKQDYIATAKNQFVAVVDGFEPSVEIRCEGSYDELADKIYRAGLFAKRDRAQQPEPRNERPAPRRDERPAPPHNDDRRPTGAMETAFAAAGIKPTLENPLALLCRPYVKQIADLCRGTEGDEVAVKAAIAGLGLDITDEADVLRARVLKDEFGQAILQARKGILQNWLKDVFEPAIADLRLDFETAPAPVIVLEKGEYRVSAPVKKTEPPVVEAQVAESVAVKAVEAKDKTAEVAAESVEAEAVVEEEGKGKDAESVEAVGDKDDDKTDKAAEAGKDDKKGASRRRKPKPAEGTATAEPAQAAAS